MLYFLLHIHAIGTMSFHFSRCIPLSKTANFMNFMSESTPGIVNSNANRDKRVI